MSVRERNAAPWRHPALAPVYAAVIAFVAVLVAGLVIPGRVDITVMITSSPGTDLSIALHGPEPEPLAEGRPTGSTWTTSQAPGDYRVCVTAGTPVRIAGSDPPDRCTATGGGTEIALAVEPVRVVVTSDGSIDDLRSTGIRVIGAEGGSQDLSLDEDKGVDLPSTAPGVSVCLRAPDGWLVRLPDRKPYGFRCQPVRDPLRDVEFVVARP